MSAAAKTWCHLIAITVTAANIRCRVTVIALTAARQRFVEFIRITTRDTAAECATERFTIVVIGEREDEKVNYTTNSAQAARDQGDV